MRWSNRLIGILSVMILARLLAPADFGVIAMASLVVGLIDVLLDLGVEVALIHNPQPDCKDYDTAWTIRLCQAAIGAAALYVGAPLAADYYHSAAVSSVLRVMALSVLVGGLENIAIVTFQKDLRFGRDFQFIFLKRIIGFSITMIAALIMRSYWAMVLGTLGGRIAGVVLSYAMHSYRPRLSLERLRHMWSFSQWVLLKNIGSYLNRYTDKLIVGGRSSAAITGAYTVADELAALPTTELLAPLGRVLFPALVQRRHAPEEFARSVSTAVGVQALVAVPACVGLAMVSSDAVYVALGPKWAMAVPIIRILAITNLLQALIHSCGYALLATGRVKALALVTWFQAVLFLTSATLVFGSAGAAELASIRLGVVFVGSMLLVWTALRKLESLTPRAFFTPLARPLLASAGMALILDQLHPLLASFIPLTRLAIEIASGGLAYVSAITILWLLARRPEGAEDYLRKNIMHIPRRINAQ